MSPCPRVLAALVLVLGLSTARAGSAQEPDSSLVTLDRIFDSDEFAPDFLGAVRWIAGAAAYTKLEPDSASPPGRALVRYDAASGRRDVWVAAARLVPPGESLPLVIEDYTLSPDGKRLLLYTNSRKVWRQNTRGDYWTLDLASWRLRKLGGPTRSVHASCSPSSRPTAAGWRTCASTTSTSSDSPTAASPASRTTARAP